MKKNIDKDRNIEDVVSAISAATQEKMDYMLGWLDGWECRKNALSANATTKPNQLQQET